MDFGSIGEFVAAEAGDGVGLPDRVLEPPRDHPEDVVAGAVPQSVVDALEESRSRTSRAGGISPRDVSARAWLRTELSAVLLASWVSGSEGHPLELDLGLAQHRRPAFDAFLEFLVDGLQVVGHQVDPGDDRSDVVPGTGMGNPGGQVASCDADDAFDEGVQPGVRRISLHSCIALTSRWPRPRTEELRRDRLGF